MSWFAPKPRSAEPELSGFVELLEFHKQFRGQWRSPSLFAAGDHGAWKEISATIPSGYFIPDVDLWARLVDATVPPAPELPRRRFK